MDRGAMTLAEVNAMSPEAFVAAFGGVAEHSPWLADHAARERPFETREAMIEAFWGATTRAPRDRKLDLIRVHPDLATRAKLTVDSSQEQQGAGLDSLTEDEFARFSDLNARYRKAFGFPFIFAVKGATKHDILASFEKRIHHSPEAEFETAIANICRILRFRIEDKVAP
jgi:2-oxo-4-hydroxy-4-carboxy-5-ureidoimidazoline decarboxylase